MIRMAHFWSIKDYPTVVIFMLALYWNYEYIQLIPVEGIHLNVLLMNFSTSVCQDLQFSSHLKSFFYKDFNFSFYLSVFIVCFHNFLIKKNLNLIIIFLSELFLFNRMLLRPISIQCVIFLFFLILSLLLFFFLAAIWCGLDCSCFFTVISFSSNLVR